MSKNFDLLRREGQDADGAASKLPLRGEVVGPVSAARTSPRAQPAAESSEWRSALHVLKKHWRLSALFCLVLVGSVAAVSWLMKPVYEPEARIQIDPAGAEVFSLETKPDNNDNSDYLETEAKNLQSDALAAEVIRKLHLEQQPEFQGKAAVPAAAAANSNPPETTAAENHALAVFKQDRQVERDPSSRLIFVRFAAHNPVPAAEVTNALVDAYIDRDFRLRESAVQQSTQFLEKQLAGIRERMNESNRTLADFQKKSGISALGENQNTFTEQMTELSRQLTQAEGDRIQLQSYLGRFQGSAAGPLPQISSNPVVQQLTQKLDEVRAELAQTLAFYGPNHPNAKKLQGQADELRRELDAQRAAVLSDLRTSYSAAQAREQMMQSQVRGAGQQMTLLAQYNALKKEADTNTQLYNTLYQRVMEAAIAAQSKSSNIRVVDRARVLDTPTRPRRLLNLGLALLAGIFGGLILPFLREGMETHVYTPEDVKKCLGADFVSIVPVMGRGEDSKLLGSGGRGRHSPLFLIDRPNSPEAEALRGLYTSLRLAFPRGTTCQVTMVASPLPGEGKTTLSVNLALALAQQGPTCIVDADLRKAGVAQMLRVAADRGLSDVLLEQVGLDEALFPVPRVPNLTLLGAGPECADPAQLTTSEAMADLVRQLRLRFDFVLIDTPPVVPFADSRALAALVDGVVLVGRAGTTTRTALAHAMQLLQAAQSAPILNIVLNAAEYPSVNYSYYRYGSQEKRKRNGNAA